MKIENHLRNLRESIEAIENAVMQGISNKQRTIGFHASAACTDMFEVLVHKNNLLATDVMIKHEWFASSNSIKEKFSFEFEGKEKLLKIISEIEKKRNIFCYGAPQKEEDIMYLIDLFNKAKEMFKEMGIHEIE